jgi:hypothetical protein
LQLYEENKLLPNETGFVSFSAFARYLKSSPNFNTKSNKPLALMPNYLRRKTHLFVIGRVTGWSPTSSPHATTPSNGRKKAAVVKDLKSAPDPTQNRTIVLQ